MLVVVAAVVGVAAGVGATLLMLQLLGGSRLDAARLAHEQLLADAQRDADATRREAQIEAREEAVTLRGRLEAELRERRDEVVQIEERVLAKEEDIDGKLTELTRREQGIADREIHLKELQEELKQTRLEERRALERVSGLTVADAKRQLLTEAEEQVRHDLAGRVRQMEEQAATEAKRRARNLVADALQRVAASAAAETTVTLVELQSDDMKGRIIGREGRNIRALEHLTGVDFIIDDTPNAVVLSSFDGIRREVARMTLEKLVDDGRIHPSRIEEMYYRSKEELDEQIRQAGEQAVFEANCGELHEELVKILGRLRYRTSYGQNVLKHTLEVVQLAGVMAAELEASVKTTKRAALLHDLGKAVTHEVEGSHAQISTQLARRYGESPAVCHAIEAHHYEVQPQTVEAVLLIAADAISASRPGARGENLEHYIKRLEALEELAAKHKGVEKVYALQAGREIRVLVKPQEIDDDGAVLLSHEIAREIEGHLEYPGQIKVTVIRESRAIDFAT
ncbi:MAG TPA: ribonuclease Y [Gaiellaceae bacterium]|nr:ribonuclease Y [Gaiellaceae bacterium]